MSFSSTTPSKCAVLGSSMVTSVTTGTCTVAANQAGNTNYNAAPQITQSLTIGKGSQIINAISFTPATLAISGTTTASTMATSGLAVSFTSTTPTICTTGGTNGSTVTGIAAGTCMVAASQAGDVNYNAAPLVTQSLTINRYIYDGGTVTDTTTWLTWRRCAVGQIWDGNTSTCSGIASSHTWAQARLLTDTFAGHNDWRLPNIRELQTIVDRTHSPLAIDSTVFPNTTSKFWSASANTGNSSYAWFIDFCGGGYCSGGYSSHYGDKNASFQTRLVRGQTSTLLTDSRPNADYVDLGDGTIFHIPTALIWKRCVEGQSWTNGNCSGTVSSYTWNQAQALSGSSFAGRNDWRIPSEDELISLVDYTIPFPGPTINPIQFPNAPMSDFWSASTSAYGPSNAWLVSFLYGYANDFDYGKNGLLSVRLVR
ncbi:hypothetical protein CCP3SC15_950011 [Gammaproteobacteria bacterium]